MNKLIKSFSLTGIIFLTACCGPVGPSWDTPWDVVYRPCHQAYCGDSRQSYAAEYNRAQERRVVRGLGGVMYQPMN